MFQDYSLRGDRHDDSTLSAQPVIHFSTLTRESNVGQPVMRKEIALRNGERARLVRMDASWIDTMLELQSKDLTSNTIKRNAADLQKLFARGDVAYGIVTGKGNLIAQATLRLNTALPEILRDKFNTAANHTPLNHAIVGCVIVDPAYEGQGICARMITACLNEARHHGVDYAHARIIEGNGASLHNFQNKFGFVAKARGQSPEATQPRTVDFMVLKLGH